jgi:delta(3,5)-delta(2,4)-dienoyl-CoA isomerase
MDNYGYKHILLQYVAPGVLELRMNRPKKRNAFNKRHYMEIGHAFTHVIPSLPDCHCVLLTGAGPIFSAGIDLAGMSSGGIGGSVVESESLSEGNHVVRRAAGVLVDGGLWQQAHLAINKCKKPVVVAIQKGCYGAALEMIAFADIRFCTSDCIFQAPEIDLGFAADVGGNQMLPKIIGNDSFMRELALTGRTFRAKEALQFGLVSRVLNDYEALMTVATKVATQIASKSSVATQSVKTMLNYTRDHTLADSMKFGLTWNAAFIQSSDTSIAGQAFMEKKSPIFSNAPVLDKILPSKM